MPTSTDKNVLWKQIIRYFLLIFNLCPISPAPLADSAYPVYYNVKFAYSIAYPKGILYPQGEADNHDGQVFLSKEADASLRVYGTNFDKNDPEAYPTIEDSYREESKGGTIENRVKVVTYKLLKNNWFVVSGYIDGKIFYQKTCYDDKQTYTLHFEYPESKRKIYDPIAKHIANSLKTKIPE